jgi:hypothetical protein
MEWRHKNSFPTRKFRLTISANKIMATVFWDFEGVFFVDYLPRGHTITGEYYAKLIPKVRQAIK